MLKNNRLLQLGFFFLTAGFWLLPFWTARVFVGFTGKPDALPAATVLSAESSRTQGQVRYLDTRNYMGVTETIVAYVYPGRSVIYPGIYTVRNPAGRVMLSQIKELKILAAADLGIAAVVYFGDTQEQSDATLSPGQAAPLNLKVTAGSSLPQPLPVEISFTVVSY